MIRIASEVVCPVTDSVSAIPTRSLLLPPLSVPEPSAVMMMMVMTVTETVTEVLAMIMTCY